jgi:hypothetical protein
LTHRGACLSRRQIEWTLFEPDNAHSGCDRTTGDDDALASAANELRHISSEAAKLFFIECVGARPSENAGAELEENAPGFPGHAELLHKPENESAQKQFPLIRKPVQHGCPCVQRVFSLRSTCGDTSPKSKIALDSTIVLRAKSGRRFPLLRVPKISPELETKSLWSFRWSQCFAE